MVRTGGTLSSKMIELIGDLNEQKTIQNVARSLRNIEKTLNSNNTKLKVNVELFGKIEDIRRDISSLQAKLNSSSSINKIKLGVELKKTTKQDINRQINEIQAGVDGGGIKKLKFEVDFDFKGSASKIKEEMRQIHDFIKRYSDQLKGTEVVNLDKDAQNVKRNSDDMQKSIGGLDRGTQRVGQSIEGQMRKMTGSTGKFAVSFKQDVNGAIQSAVGTITDADGTVNKFNYTLDESGQKISLQSRNIKEMGDQKKKLADTMTKVDTAQRQLNEAMARSPKGINDSLIRQAQNHLEVARSMEKQGRVTNEGSEALNQLNNSIKQINSSSKNFELAYKFNELRNSTEDAIKTFQSFGGSAQDVEKFKRSLQTATQGGTRDMTELKKQVQTATQEIVASGKRIDTAFSQMERQRFVRAIEEQDINSVKRYVEQLYGAKVASLQLSNTKDRLGNAVTRVKANMEAQSGAVKTYTLDMDRGFKTADTSIRQTDESTKTLGSSMGRLDGTFKSLVGRITQYFSVIRLIQVSMRQLRNMVREIQEIDKSMTELRRVADPSINTEVVLQRSISLSKELGASVNDVVGSVAEMARTFGEFNEEQLIAITRTATIMTNVSSLDLSQASGTLVSAMQAFNITAEDSIDIVNTLNEVDNNYAISTQQLADAVARSGAAARTFGVDLQELTGDITAVGAVTQESGQRIGTALRTIYSRITTIDAVRPALEEVGISLYEMGQSGPQIRDVSDVLQDLGGVWQDLNAEQQQNIGITIAGRARVTQFLALMNNYETAISATTTAYNSQGSAMREQKQYMNSYEYQMKILGASATELALTMEDKLVGDAMYLVITTTRDLVEELNNLFDTFGVLPTVVGLGMGSMVLFKGVLGPTTLAIKALVKGTQGLGGAFALAKTGMSKFIGVLFSVKTLGIGAIILGVAWSFEKLIGKIAESRRITEDAKLMTQDALETYNSLGNDISGLIDRYDELYEKRRASKDGLPIEEEREYLDLVNQISTALPQTVSHIDAQGEAHLRATEYIRDQVSVLDDLAQKNAENVLKGQEEAIKEQLGNLQKISDKVDTLTSRVQSSHQNISESYEEYVARMTSSYDDVYIMSEKAYKQMQESDLAIDSHAESVAELMSMQFALSEGIKETSIVIGDQVVALMRSNGEMENISTVGEAIIRNYSSINSAVLTEAETVEEGMDILAENSQEFGQVIRRVYDELADGINGIDSSNAIEEFDAIVRAFPEDFFQGTMEEIENGMLGVGHIIGDVMSGAEIDVEGLIDTLIRAGIESDTARRVVINLGNEFENQSIQTAIANEELAQYNDELSYTKELALETIDPLEKLFGISSGDRASMQSHIDMLQILRSEYGETWTTMDDGAESIDILASHFNVSREFIVENVDEIGDALRAIASASVEHSEETGEAFLKFDENVSKSTEKLARSLMVQGDGYSEFAQVFVQNSGLVIQSQEELEEMTDRLQQRFKSFLEDPAENNYEALLQEVNKQLNDLDGTFVMVEDSAGNFKLQMADGTNSEYLDNLNAYMEETGLGFRLLTTTVEDAQGEQITLNQVAIESWDEQLRSVYTLNDEVQDGIFGIATMREEFDKLRAGAQSDEDRENFVTMLTGQIEIFGDDLVVVKDEVGNLKFEFQNGETSPWLEELNRQLDTSTIEIVAVADEMGNLRYELSNSADENFFENIKQGAKESKDDVDEVTDSVDKMDKALRGEREGSDQTGARPIRVDNKPAIEATEEIRGSVERIGEEPIDLKIDIESVNSINDVLDTIGLAKIELKTTEERLEALRRDLRVTGEALETIMANVEVLTQANNSVKILTDNIKVAREELGHLYDMFANRSIDVSGLQTSAGQISDESDRIKASFESIFKSIIGINRAMNTIAPNFDISPIVAYRAGVQTNVSGIVQIMSHLRSSIDNYMNVITRAYQENAQQLNRYRSQVEMQFSAIMLVHRRTSEFIDREMKSIEESVVSRYVSAVTKVVQNATEFNRLMMSNKRALNVSINREMETMGRNMTSSFTRTANNLVDIASSLPRRIGMGVRANMESASSSMTALAQNMVRRFKQELGIHSPSRVFQGLGGDVIDGLVNGLSAGNLTDLGQNVFSEFSSGAISTINEIKGYMTFEPTTSGSFGSMFSRTSGFGPRKSPGGIGSTNHRGVDYGAPSGTPIPAQASGRVVASSYHGVRGNYIIIESGNGIRQLYQHNSRNNVRVGEMVGKGQIIGNVGSTGASTGPHLHYEVHVNGVPIDPEKHFRGFAEGGFVDKMELAWHGEEGLEAIIPLTDKRKGRGLDLWAETGSILGMNAEILQMMVQSQRRTGSTKGDSSFSGLDGEASSSSSETATSGTVKPDYSSVMRSMGIQHEPMFSALGPSDLEDLYKRDTNAVAVGRHSAMVRRAETELRALTQQTLKYRNALEEVNLQEKRLRNATQKQLTDTVKRQAQIEKELGKLRNTSKHTEEQRRKYNQLQQEFDRNTESIYNMENQIRQLNISMDERKLSIYTDYIGQLTSGFQNLRDEITKTTNDLQFSLDKLTLTDENNVGGQLEIQYDILRQSLRMENTLMNNMNKLQSEYSRAVSRYGKDSEQAILVRGELNSVEEQYQRTVLERIRLEKNIESTRKDVAKQGIDTLKNYYRQTQSMTEKAIELEKKALEKAHQDKMSMYDEEINKIRSIYDTRLEEMDESRAEEEYEESISQLNTQRADLMNQISRASRDNSLEGRKRLAEFQKQLDEVNQEIEKTQRDRQDKLLRQSIERQRDEQIQAVEIEKEREELEQANRLEALEKQIADAQKYTEKMINDEAMWERVTNEFVAGNTDVLSSMMEEMTKNMSKFMSGNFSGVSMGFAGLSKDDKSAFSEEMLLEISNLMVNASDSMERFVSTANERVQNIGNIRGEDYNAGKVTDFKGSTITTQGSTGPKLPPPPPPAPKPVSDNRHHTVKRGDTLWDLAQRFYGNPYQWTKIAQANHNPDPRKLQIGRKLLIPFDTGGFTGDWMGEAGRLAVLHKKELVLNEKQTSDILNVAKIVENISSIIPKLKVDRVGIGNNTKGSSGDTFVIDNLNLNMNDFKGTPQDARKAFDNMAKELKKRGKKN